jgi:hypothetical protein
MLKQLFGWGQPAALSTFDAALPREELIQNGRIAFIDLILVRMVVDLPLTDVIR